MGRKHIIHPKYHQEIINLYLTGNYSMIELAEMYGTTNRQPVVTILRQNNIQTIDRRIIQGGNVGELEDMIADGLSVPQIANEFGVSTKAITNAIERFDLDYEPQYRTYYFNEHAFDVINTEEKAYWLMFIYADGHVARTTTRITLAKKDINHLRKLRNFINGDMPLNKTIHNAYELALNSIHMVNTLSNMGIVPYRGVVHLAIRHIPKHLTKHAIRGYIDGDGCITNDKRIVILGQYDILSWIKKELYQNAGGSNQLNFRQRSGIMEGTWGGSFQFESTTKWLYKNANVYLERKMKRVLNQTNW